MNFHVYLRQGIKQSVVTLWVFVAKVIVRQTCKRVKCYFSSSKLSFLANHLLYSKNGNAIENFESIKSIKDIYGYALLQIFHYY